VWQRVRCQKDCKNVANCNIYKLYVCLNSSNQLLKLTWINARIWNSFRPDRLTDRPVNLGVGPDALPALERPNFGALAYTGGPGTARSPRKRSPILRLALRKTASSRLWLFAVLVTAMVPANAQKIVLGIEGDW
jgi:hypothetical protein